VSPAQVQVPSDWQKVFSVQMALPSRVNVPLFPPFPLCSHSPANLLTQLAGGAAAADAMALNKLITQMKNLIETPKTSEFFI
jgi:hypothetical protein